MLQLITVFGDTWLLLSRTDKFPDKQECIPVGCVLPAC